MYPYPIFLEIDLYTVFLCLGIVAALVVFRVFSDKEKMYWKLQNFAIIIGAGAITAGAGSAVLFQAFYNFLDDPSKGFSINQSTGATFYGGLIGGVVGFLLLYFIIGKFLFKSKEHLSGFFNIANIAAASIAIAHGLGRVGCLMAGCCHGSATDAWYGIYFESDHIKAVPIQLFEAIFLFALFGFFVYRILNRKNYNLSLYMSLYGLWRFVIEFFRADDRGATVVSFLSPSQLIAVLMTLGAVAVFFCERYFREKYKVIPVEETAEDSGDSEKSGEEDEN